MALNCSIFMSGGMMAEYKIGFGMSSKKPYLKVPNKSDKCVRLFNEKFGFTMRNELMPWSSNLGIYNNHEGIDFTLEHLKLIDAEVLDLPLVKQHLKAAIEEYLNAAHHKDSP